MSNRKRTLSKIAIALIVVAVTLLVAAVVGTVAYIVTHTNKVENKFIPANVGVTVEEDFDGSVKEDVKLTNTGDIGVYVRAAIVITWQDGNGNVYGKAPAAGTDYTITQAANNSWTQEDDGYWYYDSIVKPNESTANLIDSVQPVEGKAPEGYYLSVEILAQAIQAEPENVITDVWGYTPTALSAD